MPISPYGGYFFDTFIHPDFRGQNLYPILIRGLQDTMGDCGIARFYCLVDALNISSIRAHGKLGGQWLETIIFLRVLFRIHRAHSKKGRYGSLSLFASNFHSRVAIAAFNPNQI